MFRFREPGIYNQKYSMSGQALLIILIILMLISILTLSQYQQLWLHLKAQNERQQNYKTREELRIIALQLICRPIGSMKCLKTGWNSPYTKSFFSTENTCFIKENNAAYLYIWEKLSEESCLQIKSGRSGVLYRLSIKKSLRNLILQIHLVREGKGLPCTMPHVRKISNGILSWQFISL